MSGECATDHGTNVSDQEPSHDADASTRIDMCVYHRTTSKKKHRKRNLVASACCTLQELANLQAQQQCKQNSQFELGFNLSYLTSLGVEIKLNCVSRQKSGTNKTQPAMILLVAKLDLPPICKARPTLVQEDVVSDVLSGDSGDSEDQGMVPFWRIGRQLV